MTAEVHIYRSAMSGPRVRVVLTYDGEQIWMTVDRARQWRDELIRVVDEAEKRETQP